MMLQSQTLGRPQDPPAHRQPASPLFAGYCAHPTAWDELFAERGLAHTHSRLILDRLGRLLAPEFQLAASTHRRGNDSWQSAWP